MQRILILIALSVLVSCKSKKGLIGEQSAYENAELVTVVKGHYGNQQNFSTANFRASARYEDHTQSQNVTAEIRIKKDEKILVLVRFFGITMAKALITPEKVSYYEKINGKYFEGNYQLLSNWLGTPLDYEKVQNLFLGRALDDLTKEQYTVALENGLHVLKNNPKASLRKMFMFEAANFLLKKETIEQETPEGPRSVDVTYPSHKESEKGIYPAEIHIEAHQKEKVSIKIAYNHVTFNEDLSFTYDVPEGYEQIFID